MKRYIKAMSMTKKDAMRHAGSFSSTLMEHIVKLVMYGDIRPDDVSDWLQTVCRCLHEVDGLTVKPSNKKLSAKDLEYTIFGSMGDEAKDYRLVLAAFQEDNKHGKFNYDDKVSYPEFDLTDDAVINLMSICYEFMNRTTPLLLDKKDHSIDEYKDAIRDLFE